MKDKLITLALALLGILAVVVLVVGLVLVNGDEASGAPKRWTATPITFKTTVPPAGTQVWISPETADVTLAEATWHAAAFWNGYTDTKLNCTTVLITSPKAMLTCGQTSCPTASYCLKVRVGDLPVGQVARYEPSFCAGGCTRAGIITVDLTEPPFGGFHPWGPAERAMVVQHYIGRFIGIAVNPDCTSVMYATLTCPTGGRVPNVLTASEATQAGAW